MAIIRCIRYFQFIKHSLCEALCGGPQKERQGNKTRVRREEDTDSDKNVNELRVFYLLVLFDHYCKFVV